MTKGSIYSRKKIYQCDRIKLSAGFTLIELLIAASIFAIIALFATGSLVSVFNSNRKATSLQNVMTNLNFTFEEMSREIRYGEVYHCGTTGSSNQPRNCVAGDTYITFQFDEDDDSDLEQIEYEIISKPGGVYGLTREVDNGGADELISGDVDITYARFYVTGAATGDNLQPKVTIVIHAKAGAGNTETEFTLQTTLVQRKEEI